ncbi:hypothetical protein [Pseudomonas sp. zfem002]|uniref:hypothetical protein n=1 Tax=Pseudomonas sp. zfem002 TaxID=3078197 RepID=UPI002929ED17|nr:hypothetical protein [Pseudomonas sp. zfem002]MDU9393968.1 hypothetical protein [Pseudomonas sp. zfem002]
MDTDRVITIGGLGQVRQLLQRVGTIAERMAPVAGQQFGFGLWFGLERTGEVGQERALLRE